MDKYLINKGQNLMSQQMIDFANNIPDIKSIEDLKDLDEQFYGYFEKVPKTDKFERTSSEIFEYRKISGCSDIGLAISPILRYKGVPTVYVESGKIEWINNVINNKNIEQMSGHIFLEIFLNGKWYLYDPTFHYIYDNYDNTNPSLPRGYYVFLKGLNCHEFGICSVQDEKRYGITYFQLHNKIKYEEPCYNQIDIRFLKKEKEMDDGKDNKAL